MKARKIGLCLGAVVIVVLICVIALHYRGGSSPDRSDRPSPTSTKPSTSVSAPSTTASVQSPAVPTVSTATVANLVKRADPAVRVYGAYPNKQGKAPLLAQLKPLVSHAALVSIEHQWTGPEVTTASNSVTDIQYGHIAYTSATMSSIDMTVYIKGKTEFSKTPSTTFDVPVDVRFTYVDTDWVISNITTPYFPSN